VHEELLDEQKREVLKLQGELVRSQRFFLAGGTALSLHLGHRISADLDWFSAQKFDEKALIAQLDKLSTKPSQTTHSAPHTVRAYYGHVETSFIHYAQVRGKARLVKLGTVQVPIADLALIAAMKAAALHDRGAKRDFVDVHALCRSGGWSVERFIQHAATVLPLTPKQVAMSMCYFADAEHQPMPQGCMFGWEQIKRELEKGVRVWERTRDRGRGR